MSSQQTLITTRNVETPCDSHQLRLRCLRSGRALCPWRGAEQASLAASMGAGEGASARAMLVTGAPVNASARPCAASLVTAMVRAHSRASVMSVINGNSRRNSTAAANSPFCSRAVRIAAASASETTNISGAWERGPQPASACGCGGRVDAA
jgi:hypothetical protein